MSEYVASESCIEDGIRAAQEVLLFTRESTPAARQAVERLRRWIANAEQYIDEGVIEEIERDAAVGELFDEEDL